MIKLFGLYKNAFGGLSPAAWVLALVIFINRSGTMVLPFLSVYLVSSLDYTLVEAGWVMTVYGSGAIIGSYLGGWLTDKIGHFRVQFASLMLSGTMFFIVMHISSFYPLLMAVFCASIITETMRPANQASIASYARPENVTRAFSLNRMAINLGFSVGPAIGGFLAAESYDWIFIADGVTCILAGFVFYFYFRNKKSHDTHQKRHEAKSESVWADRKFLMFVVLVAGFAVLFFQLFTTWPIYHREVYHLSEEHIGFLLGLNGFIVFFFEMVLVYKIGERVAPGRLMAFGTGLIALAFASLFVFDSLAALYLACVLISFGEIFAMPFMVTYTVKRSGTANKGAYLGLYSMAFASAFAIAPLIGTNVIEAFGYDTWWMAAAALAFLLSVGFYKEVRG